jgi:hypothetical protein
LIIINLRLSAAHKMIYVGWVLRRSWIALARNRIHEDSRMRIVAKTINIHMIAAIGCGRGT